MRRRLPALILMASPLLLMPSCSQPSRICDLVCECEHCNDIREDYECDQISASQDIAEIYECEKEWGKWADCYEDKGECDEKEARFSTREPGSCSATADSGTQCMTDADCVGIYNGATCDPTTMTCHYKACNDGGMQPCSSNDECNSGADRCEDEVANLAECLTEASDDPSFIGGFDSN